MGKKNVTRREFLELSSITLAGGYLGLKSAQAAAGMMGGGMGGMGGGMGGMGGGSTGVIDPPPGLRFQDPPVLQNMFPLAKNLVEVSLEASATPVNLNGSIANLLTYNGSFPGPTIRVRNTDTLRIHFRNSLSIPGTNILGHVRDITNLHTHGLHVSPMGNSDNVMVMVEPGGEFVYEYNLSMHRPGTLDFYHPHVHGTVAEQYWGGLAGALIVEDDLSVLEGFETHLMVLKDISIAGGNPAPYDTMMDYMHGKEGNQVTVNGQVNPVLPIRPGQVQRWRILNASNARYYKLALEGHMLQLVGTDGGLLDRPYPLSQIVVAPGERVDLLVKANPTTRNYRLLSLAYDRGCGGMGQQVTLLTMSCKGKSSANDAGIPAVVDPEAVRIPLESVATRQLVLSMGQGKGYINGVSFAGMNATTTVDSSLGTCEVWEIVNQSGMDHPFHQHVNPCQVLSVTGGDPASAALYANKPAWKDVVNIPRGGSARLLVPVDDFDGMAMFHCHIVEHEDIGMMGIWNIMP